MGEQVAVSRQAVIGWRAWSAQGLELASPMMETPWQLGQLSWNGSCQCVLGDMVKRYERSRREVEAQMIELMQRPCSYGDPELMHQLVERHIEYLRELALEAVSCSECLCGINAFASRELLAASSYVMAPGALAAGTVELTGEVRAYELGWRAERARASELWTLWPEDEAHVRSICARVGADYMGVWACSTG
jgi:hypothetical protein